MGDSRKWIQESLSKQVGCRLPWDNWTHQGFPKCASLDEYRCLSFLIQTLWRSVVVGILRLFTKTSAWRKEEAWRSWQGARNLVNTGNMRWLEVNNQPPSDLNSLPSPFGPCLTKQLCGRRCQSTLGLPLWPNLVEPSAFFLTFSSLPLWLFGVASRSCYPFFGPNITDHGNTTCMHSMHIT